MNDLYARIWLFIAAGAALPLGFYVRRAYLNHKARQQHDVPPREMRAAAIISLSMMIGITAAFSFFFTPGANPGPLWLHLFQVQAFAYMYLLNYSVNYWLTLRKPYVFVHGWLTYVTLLATITAAGLAYLSRDNYGHIFTNDEVRPTGLYFTYYGLSLPPSIVTQFFILRLFVQSIVNNNDLTWRIRRSVGLFAMLGCTASTCIALINLMLFMSYGNTYRAPLNVLFYCTAPMILLIPFINAVKQSTLERLALPLKYHLHKRKQHDQALLTYLHQHLTNIAPRVVLDQDTLFNDRILAELSHARQVVWSYTPPRLPVTAKAEAGHIFALLFNENVIEESGPYAAPSPWRTSEKNHFVQIALHLKKLETQLGQEVSYDV